MDEFRKKQVTLEVDKVGLTKFMSARMALMLNLLTEVNSFMDEGGLHTADEVCTLTRQNIIAMEEIRFLFCGDED